MTNSEIGLLVGGILGILVGIAVIVWPRVLAYMVGTYLIIVGVIHHSRREMTTISAMTSCLLDIRSKGRQPVRVRNAHAGTLGSQLSPEIADSA